MSIGMHTPEAVHMQTGEQRRYWKNSRAMGYNEKKAYICQSVQVLRYRSTWIKPTSQTAAL